MAKKKVYRPGGMLSGKKFTIDNDFLKYVGAVGIGSGFLQIPLRDIDTISVDKAGMGTTYLKIVGKGTELGKIKLPAGWAMKAQRWLIENTKE